MNTQVQEHTSETLENSQPKHEVHESTKQEVVTPKSISDRYIFTEEIGHGAQGRIYRAVRLSDNRTVVIKQLNVSSVKTWKEYELFKREGEVLKSIDMPGVAHFYDAIECLDEEPAYSYIVQEFIPGASLKKMIDEGHRFKVDDVYNILIQALRILDKLHHHDPVVIHRDIKPSNIMITPDSTGNLRVTIIDFGAVANPQIQGGGSTVAGTYGYMPPEQLTGKPCPASDVYALAAVGVHLFSGKSPADMPVKDFRLIFEPEMQDKPHELVTLLRKMLDPNVDNRLAYIPSVIENLEVIKNNQFKTKIDADPSSVYSKDYEEALKAVQSVGENGNIDLWENLSDKTPRRVPTAFVSRITMDSKLAYPLANLKLFPRDKIPLIVACVTLFLGVTLVCLKFVDSTEVLYFLIFWVLICGPLMMLILWDSIHTPIMSSMGKNSDNQTNDDNLNSTQTLAENSEIEHTIAGDPRTFYNQVLTHGRKTIAEILSIRYLPLKNSEITVMENNTKNGNIAGINKSMFYRGLPKFEVQYVFNPPDDRRKQSIVHSFVTHVNPMDYCKIGDPLPILYFIEDCFFYDTVKSMPFPYPIDDIYDLEQILDESSSNDSRFVPDEDSDDNAQDDLIERHRMELNIHFRIDSNSELERYIDEIDLKYLNSSCQMNLCRQLEETMSDSERSEVHASCMMLLWKLLFDNSRLSHDVRVCATKIISNYVTHRPRSWLKPNREAIIQLFYMIKQYEKSVMNSNQNDFMSLIWESLIDMYGDLQTHQMLRASILDHYHQIAPKRYVKKMYDALRYGDTKNVIRCIQGNLDYWLRVYKEACEDNGECIMHNAECIM